jgi:DNA-binding transcriptional regulator LsrR (DeoR family)
MLVMEPESRHRSESEWVRRAWDLRIDGCSVREIAERLGISYAQARRLVQLAYTNPGMRLSETAEVARELDLARLDQLIRAYLPLALNNSVLAKSVLDGEKVSPEDAAVPFAVAKIILETLNQRAKLHGLYIYAKLEPGQARQDVLAWVQSVAPSIQRAVNDLECALESGTTG